MAKRTWNRPLAAAAIVWGISFAIAPAAILADESDDEEPPVNRLLRQAIMLYEDGAREIRLVQGEEATGEALQPSDTSGLFERDLGGLQRGIGGPIERSLDDIFADPAFASFTSSSVSSVAQVSAQEEISGRLSTALLQTAPVDIVPASTVNLVSTPDIAETIAQVGTAPTVHVRRRSPVSAEARVRGYQGGQLFAMLDGAYLTPVRSDLDALLTKVDPSLIGNTEIISGPYGLRYGSGFSFINVDTIPTPRYECGWENHLRLGTNLRTNGGQTYNTATLFGGGESMGYYANVGFRKGSDYEAGNGLNVPSSYEVMNLFSVFGMDLDDNTRSVTRLNILNQGETEYAGQFFDVDNLDHQGVSQSIIHLDEESGLGYRVDAWYSNTEFDGDTANSGKRAPGFPVLQRVDLALSDAQGARPVTNPQFFGAVEGDLQTAGFRSGATIEVDQDLSVGAGADLRYIRQQITERYDITDFFPGDPTALFSTGLPSSETIDPGLYIEGSAGLTPYLRLAAGSRIAFATTQANAGTLQDRSNFRDPLTGELNRDLDSYDVLGSAFVSADLEINRNWSSRIGVGYAERLPDLTDRYSDGLFIAVAQNGFSRVIGRPELDKERNVQFDARLEANYDAVRGRLSAFHAWIFDYITYSANVIEDPTGARLLQTLNTDLGTLAGFEAYGELDLTEGWQSFASLTYVDGRDREINQPLFGISPLESRIGLRVLGLNPQKPWGLEWGWRIVDNQDRLGTVRPVGGAGNQPDIRLEDDTPGFATTYLRSYYRPAQNVSMTAGIENLLDRTYYEHLNLRLPADGNFGATRVLSPGITPYFGVEVEY